jgi:hypothetical protein
MLTEEDIEMVVYNINGIHNEKYKKLMHKSAK